MPRIVTYSVNTTGADLQNNYSRMGSGWELTGSGPSGDREYVETWQFSTDMPQAVAGLLDQEPCVLNYIEVSREDDVAPWWK